jgi:fibronectin type 3 domain-containing protein
VNKSIVVRTACLLAALSAVSGFAWFRLSVRSKPHRVILTWRPPVPVTGVKIIGYNVYRSTTPSGPYVKLASEVREATYADEHVDGGATYSYVVTAVDDSHRESKYSQDVTVHIPVATH